MKQEPGMINQHSTAYHRTRSESEGETRYCWWAGAMGCIHYLQDGNETDLTIEVDEPRASRENSPSSLLFLPFFLLPLLIRKTGRAAHVLDFILHALAVGWGSSDRGERDGTGRLACPASGSTPKGDARTSRAHGTIEWVIRADVSTVHQGDLGRQTKGRSMRSSRSTTRGGRVEELGRMATGRFELALSG